MAPMKTTAPDITPGPGDATPAASPASAETHSSTEAAPTQLSLLPESSAPVRFRLDAATRRRGLRHVAEMRALLAQRQAVREASTTGDRLPATPRGTTGRSRRPDRAA